MPCTACRVYCTNIHCILRIITSISYMCYLCLMYTLHCILCNNYHIWSSMLSIAYYIWCTNTYTAYWKSNYCILNAVPVYTAHCTSMYCILHTAPVLFAVYVTCHSLYNLSVQCRLIPIQASFSKSSNHRKCHVMECSILKSKANPL